MELSTNDLITQTRALLNAARGSLIKVGENLFTLKQQLPPELAWADMLRDEFDIGEGQASKLIKIFRVFAFEGGLSPEKLEGIDGERLYLAAGLEGTPEEKLAKAANLTRSELRAERQDEEPHEYEPLEFCKICHAKKENHN